MRRLTGHVRPNETDWITLQLYLRGGMRGHCGGDTSLTIDTATVGLLDLSHTFAAYSEPSDVIWVCIPRDRLISAERLAKRSAMPAWSRKSQRGWALASSVVDLWERLSGAGAEDGAYLADEITESVNCALQPGEFVPTDCSRRRAMKNFIAANLADLDLNADRVRSEFHCSRSAMYRILQDDGGVARHIREMRLVLCADELTRPGGAHRRISEIATNWGFENPSHFHRLFDERFGVAPSVMRASGEQNAHRSVKDPYLGEMISEFHDWVSSSARLRSHPYRVVDANQKTPTRMSVFDGPRRQFSMIADVSNSGTDQSSQKSAGESADSGSSGQGLCATLATRVSG